jgi:hypothetical protein
MASTQPAVDPLSERDHLLVEKTEEAIRDGLQLEQWLRGRTGDLALFPLALGKKFRLPNRAEGFFGSLEINGQPRTVMGCRQEVDFGRFESDDLAGRLREFVLGEFLKRAHWTYDDGSPGGFTVEQSLYKAVGNLEYQQFSPDCRNGCMDWRHFGSQYDWVLLTVYIHDFVMDFGPIRKRFREAACVAPNTNFVHVVEHPSKEYALEVSVGYPFVEVTPIPNVFGFGPGKFGVAVKLFSFFLTHQNEVQARMFFAAAPRCSKVFDFGKRWPDPVYGGARMLQRLSLGRWNPSGFHDRVDTGMLVQHCRVHQALMDGVERVWRDWLAGGPMPSAAR